MEKTDILIIGAGVVGLAIARELSGHGKEVVLVEKNSSFGQETSSRNSEVIHGGMYYPAGTLKAKLCVEGRNMLYDLCKNNNIPHKKTGKLIVATEKDEIPFLENILSLGRMNGVSGLTMLDEKELMRLEPHISAITALYSPETGIIDSHRLMQFFLDSAKDKGVIPAFSSEVTVIEKKSEGYKVLIRNNNESMDLQARIVINSAGLDADKIAAMAGMDIDQCKYRLYYCKGQYFRIKSNKARLVNGLVYPVPKPKSGGLGIHATVDLNGEVRLGPDDMYLPENIKDYSTNESKKNYFYVSARKFMPFLEESDLFADTTGIRPKLQPKGGDFRDFVIREESDQRLPGFIDLIGIESPGLTASLAIARLVGNLAEKY
jgi:L-2-hydroxyglutarate oxidase LhgO